MLGGRGRFSRDEGDCVDRTVGRRYNSPKPTFGIRDAGNAPYLGEVANQGSREWGCHRRRQTPGVRVKGAGARMWARGRTMLRNTLRMINQQDQWFNQLRREESARRTLRYSLYRALEQVERLLESDMMEVPIEMQARLRQIVEAVDPQLAYRIDQSGPSALDIQDIIFEAQDRLIKTVRT